ncbi:MAG: hypothetical protein FJ385_09695, partial [Verrucomicrobia bacterium]|nr:hypothetical protein [Verrucomicrobiota bacterium]
MDANEIRIAATAMENAPHVEPGTIDDLPALTDLVVDLMGQSGDFTVDRETHERGLRLILEQPNRGRILVLR